MLYFQRHCFWGLYKGYDHLQESLNVIALRESQITLSKDILFHMFPPIPEKNDANQASFLCKVMLPSNFVHNVILIMLKTRVGH